MFVHEQEEFIRSLTLRGVADFALNAFMWGVAIYWVYNLFALYSVFREERALRGRERSFHASIGYHQRKPRKTDFKRSRASEDRD